MGIERMISISFQWYKLDYSTEMLTGDDRGV